MPARPRDLPWDVRLAASAFAIGLALAAALALIPGAGQ